MYRFASRIACAASCMLLWLPAAFAAAGDLVPVTTVEGITEYRLDNGLQVLLFPDPSSSTVTVNVTYLVGSRHEGRGEKGMAHLLEHMVFKGTDTLDDIWGALEDHGANFNGSTWVDRTNYFETLPASDGNLEFAIGMEADRMVNSRVSEEDLAKEMTVVRNEFEMGENSPTGVLFERMLSTAYLWHNYGFSTIGNRTDIERVPAANLKRFYKEYYQPDNAMLAVAGKFDGEKALALIETHFGAIPKPDRVLAETWTEEPVQDGARAVTLKRVGDVPAVGLLYHVPPGSHEDFPAVEVLQEVLTSQPAGRLYKALVEPGDLTSIEGYSFAWAEPGVAVMLGQVAPEHQPEEVLEKMEVLSEGLGAEPATEDEVERIKTRLLKEIKLSLTDSGRIGIELSEWAALGDWRLFFLHRDRLKAVSADDVNRAAGAYLLESNRTSGLFYPTEDPKRAAIPDVPDIAKVTEGYTGTETIALGEDFDATPENIEARTERAALGEHLKLALLPKQTRGESVQLFVRFHFGDEAGLTPWVTETNFIPSMLLRGTRSLSYQALQDRIDTLQSKISFTGGPGLLEAQIETDKTNLLDVVALLGSMLREPAFDAAEFAVVQNEQQSALEEGLSDPQTLAMKAVTRAARPFPAGSIHYTPTQQEALDRMRALTLERVRECYANFYGGTYGEIAAVGDFDSAAIQGALSAALDGWQTPAPYTRIERPYLSNTTGLERIETPDKQMAVVTRCVSFPLTDTDPAYAAFDFGVYILGQSAKSRLLTSLRHEGGLSYGAGAFTRVSSEDPGAMLAGFAICKPDNAAKVLEVMTAEMERWRAEGVTDAELKDGQESYALQLKNDLADDSKVVRMLAEDLEIGRTFAFQSDLVARIRALAPGDVKAVLAQLLGDREYQDIVAGDLP